MDTRASSREIGLRLVGSQRRGSTPAAKRLHEGRRRDPSACCVHCHATHTCFAAAPADWQCAEPARRATRSSTEAPREASSCGGDCATDPLLCAGCMRLLLRHDTQPSPWRRASARRQHLELGASALQETRHGISSCVSRAPQLRDSVLVPTPEPCRASRRARLCRTAPSRSGSRLLRCALRAGSCGSAGPTDYAHASRHVPIAPPEAARYMWAASHGMENLCSQFSWSCGVE